MHDDVTLHIKAKGEAQSSESDGELIDEVFSLASQLDDFEEVSPQAASLGGSEDFSYMMKRVQEKGGRSTFMMLGSDLKGGHQVLAGIVI